ncbi:MAG: hypothetical protein JEY91_19105 [Spirochaetaceae bacterium]|nr:hypothetical protein [Spirochaetaceae bacterium]
MGLLNKALIIDNREDYFSPDIQSMMSSLDSINNGLDFPSVLFSHIMDALHIHKGALLLPEDEFSFIPWAETGFDKTTSRRIRIPRSLLEIIRRKDSYDFFELYGTELDTMRDFFSFREFSVTDLILFAPILFENQLMAILLISQADVLNRNHADKKDIFKELSDSTGPLLFNRREIILNKLEEISLDNDNFEEILNQYIDQYKNSSFLGLTLFIDQFIVFLNKKNYSSVPQRIKQDILRLLKTLIAQRGDVFNYSKDSFIILLKKGRVEEAELFVHQIGLSLCYFYKVSSSDFKPVYNIIRFPEDKQSFRELVNSFN